MGGWIRLRRIRLGVRTVPVVCAFIVLGCASTPSPTAPAETVASQANLSQAVDAGDSSRVLDLVDQDVDLDQPVVLGLTPLMRAANRDYAGIAEILIEGGADVHAPGMDGLTPVHVAARANSVETLEVLLGAGADPTVRSRSGMNALDHAARGGAVEALELLAGSGDLDVDGPSEVVAQGHGYPRDIGPTPLAIAVRAGELETIRALLKMDADVNAPSTAGHTPLLVAVFSGQPAELVQLLLEAGADREVTADCVRGCSAPEDPDTALTAEEWAATLERTELVELFAAARGQGGREG